MTNLGGRLTEALKQSDRLEIYLLDGAQTILHGGFQAIGDDYLEINEVNSGPVFFPFSSIAWMRVIR